ncbi:MAG: hypothetical protein WCG05_01175 [Alphaproteobacteria bacterium]
MSEDSDLGKLISRYNKILKTDRNLAEERIQQLKKISMKAEEEMLSVPDNKCLDLIKITATNKAAYLEQVLKIKDKAFRRAIGIMQTPQGKTLGRRVGEHYKKEWPLSLDPANRSPSCLGGAFDQWNKLVDSPEGKDIPEFYFWLEGKPGWSSCQIKDLENYPVVFFKDGHAQITYPQGFIGSRPGGRIPGRTGQNQGYLYAIDSKGEFHFTEYNISSVPHHPDLVRGDLVVCAGIVDFNSKGFITYIDVSSGHYAPYTIHLRKGMILMKEYYKNDHIFDQLAEYGYYNNREQFVKTKFSSIENIPAIYKNFDKMPFSFKELYDCQAKIPEDLKDSITIYYRDFFAPRGKLGSLRTLFTDLAAVHERIGDMSDPHSSLYVNISDPYSSLYGKVPLEYLTQDSLQAIIQFLKAELLDLDSAGANPQLEALHAASNDSFIEIMSKIRTKEADTLLKNKKKYANLAYMLSQPKLSWVHFYDDLSELLPALAPNIMINYDGKSIHLKQIKDFYDDLKVKKELLKRYEERTEWTSTDNVKLTGPVSYTVPAGLRNLESIFIQADKRSAVENEKILAARIEKKYAHIWRENISKRKAASEG